VRMSYPDFPATMDAMNRKLIAGHFTLASNGDALFDVAT